MRALALHYKLEDDLDDDPDEDDDLDEGGDEEGDEDDEDDEDDDDEEEVETWQVSSDTIPLKYGPSLTSGSELPRLAPNSSSAGVARLGERRRRYANGDDCKTSHRQGLRVHPR
jgi:hypothetical protein